MFDESFCDFKNYFFKVRAVEGARPFILDENDEPAFPLEWKKDVRVSRYTWEMLDEAERAFVTILEEHWGQPPHLDTKKFLTNPSLLLSICFDEAWSSKKEGSLGLLSICSGKEGLCHV